MGRPAASPPAPQKSSVVASTTVAQSKAFDADDVWAYRSIIERYKAWVANELTRAAKEDAPCKPCKGLPSNAHLKAAADEFRRRYLPEDVDTADDDLDSTVPFVLVSTGMSQKACENWLESHAHAGYKYFIDDDRNLWMGMVPTPEHGRVHAEAII